MISRLRDNSSSTGRSRLNLSPVASSKNFFVAFAEDVIIIINFAIVINFNFILNVFTIILASVLEVKCMSSRAFQTL